MARIIYGIVENDKLSTFTLPERAKKPQFEGEVSLKKDSYRVLAQNHPLEGMVLSKIEILKDEDDFNYDFVVSQKRPCRSMVLTEHEGMTQFVHIITT